MFFVTGMVQAYEVESQTLRQIISSYIYDTSQTCSMFEVTVRIEPQVIPQKVIKEIVQETIQVIPPSIIPPSIPEVVIEVEEGK